MSAQSDVGRQSKVVVIAVTVAFVALGYVAMTWFAAPSNAQSQVASVQSTEQGKATKETPAYSQVLQRYNNQNADAAAQSKEKESYLSVLSDRTEDVPPPVTAPPPAPPLPPPTVYYQQASAPPDPERARELDAQTKALLATWIAVPHSEATVATDAAAYAKSLQRPEVRPVQVSAADDYSSAAARKIVDDFAMMPAILETDIDTDENSIVSAYIPGGRYAGARVYASAGYKRLTNTVDISFDYMQWQGRSYKITAKAVDQHTNRSALSGDVNNRYFTRVLVPALAGGIGRTGQLYEQAAATQSITPLGGVINTFPRSPDGGAIAGTVVGGVGTQAGQVLASDAAKMPVKQVTIPKGTTIGVQFVGAVLESDDTALGAVSIARVPNDTATP